MRRFWNSDHPWLFGFLAGLVVALLMFHFRPAERRVQAHPASAPRWIQTPKASRSAVPILFASQFRSVHSSNKENL
ncbi:MAG TPA: hypothetical protein VGF16_01175 [Bryobacteraceae bacterium]|jgi:hypothetical protein